MIMKSKGLRGVHVFWITAAFFGVIFVVDGVFIARAVGTFPGEDVPNSYVQGIDYNQTIAQRAVQKQLGWTAEVGFGDRSPRTLIVRIMDASGSPVSDLDVRVFTRIVGKSSEPTRTTLSSEMAGEYAGHIDAPHMARVEVIAEARRPGNGSPVFQASKTLVAN
jgi:nitrogen fixation protein FixH